MALLKVEAKRNKAAVIVETEFGEETILLATKFSEGSSTWQVDESHIEDLIMAAFKLHEFNGGTREQFRNNLLELI